MLIQVFNSSLVRSGKLYMQSVSIKKFFIPLLFLNVSLFVHRFFFGCKSWGCSSVVDHYLHMPKAVDPICSITKKKKNEKIFRLQIIFSLHFEKRAFFSLPSFFFLLPFSEIFYLSIFYLWHLLLGCYLFSIGNLSLPS